MQKKGKGPIILTGIGCLFAGLSLLVVVVSLSLPSLTSGRTSWDEATMGIIPGGVCCGLSSLVLLGGLGWMLFSSREGANSP